MGLCYKCSVLVAIFVVLLGIGPTIYYHSDQREYNRRTTAEEAAIPNKLSGQIVIVTGSSSGIGIPTAKVLYAHGATVIMACRNRKKANMARESILQEITEQSLSPSNLQVMELDLGSLESVAKFVKEFTASYDALNILINNAGVMGFDNFTLSTDGIETQFAVNHIGHFSLTQQLTPLLVQSATNDRISRVINVASAAYIWSPMDLKSWYESSEKIQDPEMYSPFGRYGFTKATNIIYSREYNKRFKDQNVYSISLHPGTIKTGLSKYNSWTRTVEEVTPRIVLAAIRDNVLKTVSQGAATQVRVAVMPQEEFTENGGKYYEDCNVASMTRTDIIQDGANSDELGRLLWDLSEKMIKEHSSA